MRLAVYIDWLITIVILIIGLYHILLLIPMELIGAWLGQTIIVGVQNQKISTFNIIVYLLILCGTIVLVVEWKHKTLSFWLKIAGVTSVVISKLIWPLILLPYYARVLTG
jgi:hypothetical protein